MRPALILIFLLLISVACQQQQADTPFDEKQQAFVIDEVEAAVWAFHAADTSMNADEVIGLCWPEMTMLVDGNRIKYEDIKKGSKQFMSSLVLFHTEWEDLQVIPISESAAISSFIFTDSIINKSGELTQARGPNTFLWQKRDGEWRVLYGDADHYPIGGEN